MTVVVSHPTANANLRAVLKAVAGRDLLDSFWTALAVPPALADCRALGLGVRRELGRRTFPEVPWDKIRSSPLREIARIAGRHAGWHRLIRHETGWASFDRVCRQIDREAARYLSGATAAVRAVYAYEDGAEFTFTAARERDIVCIYDLPAMHWRMFRELMLEEAELRPAWAKTITGLQDSEAKLARKDREILLADRITVASSFTHGSLIAGPFQDIDVTIAPYGAPPPLVGRASDRTQQEPIRLFYAGNITAGKGIAYLIEALVRLDLPWQLTLAGALPLSAPKELDELLADPRCTWLGHVPHQTLLEALTKAHVFVFPSIADGFGMVLFEAMAAGLPVITTTNTAGPDIMRDGCEGFIVPIRDADAIADRLALLYADESRRQEMAMAALACAARSGWETYEARIADIVEEVMT